MNILCKLGLHRWKEHLVPRTRPITNDEMNIMLAFAWFGVTPPHRKFRRLHERCNRCGKVRR